MKYSVVDVSTAAYFWASDTPGNADNNAWLIKGTSAGVGVTGLIRDCAMSVRLVQKFNK